LKHMRGSRSQPRRGTENIINQTRSRFVGTGQVPIGPVRQSAVPHETMTEKVSGGPLRVITKGNNHLLWTRRICQEAPREYSGFPLRFASQEQSSAWNLPTAQRSFPVLQQGSITLPSNAARRELCGTQTRTVKPVNLSRPGCTGCTPVKLAKGDGEGLGRAGRPSCDTRNFRDARGPGCQDEDYSNRMNEPGR